MLNHVGINACAHACRKMFLWNKDKNKYLKKNTWLDSVVGVLSSDEVRK